MADKTLRPMEEGVSTIKEGLAYILVPSDAPTALDPKVSEGDRPYQSVFYNPIQQFNRDLTVLAIRAYGEDLMAARRISKASKPPRGKKRKRGLNGDDVRTDLAPSAEQSKATDVYEDIDAPRLNGNSDADEKLHNNETSVNHDAAGGVQTSGNTSTNNLVASHEESKQPKVDCNTKFKILDALSATGLRAIRYAQEIPFVTAVIANDLSPEATASIAANVKFNKLDSKVKVTTENAMSHLYDFASKQSAHPRSKYEVIDLDPYGTAAPFLDASMQAIADGGLLCVTCTDAGVWASCGYPEKTFALYGGTPVKGYHSHEGGLRLILHAIATSAARYGMSIEPLMCLSIDFYARVFVRVFKSPLEVKLLAGKTMLVYNCDAGCGAWTTQLMAQNKPIRARDGSLVYKHSLAQGPSASTFCDHCGTKTHMSGPMYAGPLHNPDFLATILNYLPDLDKKTYTTLDRIEGMVSTALEELLLDDNLAPEGQVDNVSSSEKRPVPRSDPAKVDTHPFFFSPSALAKVIHCRAPPEAEIKGALRHAGYNATRSHAKPGSIRTNAPWSFIWKLMLEWARRKAPIKDGAIKPGTAGWKIMQKHAENQAEDASTIDKADNGIEKKDTGQNNEPSGGDTIVFDEKLGREDNKKRLMRYQHNPRANWGPMNRAKKKLKENKEQEQIGWENTQDAVTENL